MDIAPSLPLGLPLRTFSNPTSLYPIYNYKKTLSVHSIKSLPEFHHNSSTLLSASDVIDEPLFTWKNPINQNRRRSASPPPPDNKHYMHTPPLWISCLALVSIALDLSASPDPTSPESPEADALFEETLASTWQKEFEFSGKTDWSEDWFLDGLKAEVKPTEKGLLFTAGPTRDDHASHAVLWTKQSFEGDLLIQYDYTRLDTVDYAVTILYLHAEGVGRAPFASDISEWSDFREIPYMRSYFNHMNLLHISYAAHFNQSDQPREQYIHARRYPVLPTKTFSDTGLGQRTLADTLIEPGVTYEITAAKIAEKLLFSVKPKGEDESTRRSFIWDTSAFAPLTQGRIGLRHMWTRSARYANFRVATLQPKAQHP